MDGIVIRPGTSDMSVIKQVYFRQTYRPTFPIKPRVILDLGAYTGISTRWFCDTYPQATVIGVEPNPISMALAQRNAPRAEFYEAAVSGKVGTAVLVRTSQGAWADSIMREGSTIAQVQTLTVDRILDGRRADIVKVDIEAAERDVFAARGEWLNHVRLLFVETHDRYLPGCAKAMYKALDATGRGYSVARRGGGKVDADLTVVFE